MNLSAFKNPLVIASIFGVGILSAGATYVGNDCSQARAQAKRQAAEKAELDRLLGRTNKKTAPKPMVDPKKYEENPFNFPNPFDHPQE